MSSDRQRALLVAGVLLGSALARAQAPDEAELVRLLFPGANVVRVDVVLTAAQQQAVVARSQGQAPVAVVRHVASRDGKVVGVAYVDARKVRTHGQSLLVGVDAAGKVLRVEVIAFAEPRQYRPRPEFYAQFVGCSLDDTLRLRRAIRPVAGATMSAVAAVDAVRAALAVHAVLGATK